MQKKLLIVAIIVIGIVFSFFAYYISSQQYELRSKAAEPSPTYPPLLKSPTPIPRSPTPTTYPNTYLYITYTCGERDTSYQTYYLFSSNNICKLQNELYNLAFEDCARRFGTLGRVGTYNFSSACTQPIRPTGPKPTNIPTRTPTGPTRTPTGVTKIPTRTGIPTRTPTGPTRTPTRTPTGPTRTPTRTATPKITT